jgi:hypothetical protein
MHGVEHSVEVQAGSVYEATCLALVTFRQHDWSAEGSDWTGVLTVKVKQPDIKHKLRLEKFRDFLQAKSGSPREITQRQKLNEILNGK